MMRYFLLFLLSGCLLQAGDPTSVRRLQLGYELAVQKWIVEAKAAKDPAVQAAVWARKPDPNEAGAKIWREIRDNLAEPWTIDPAVWLLANAPQLMNPQGQADGARPSISPAELVHLAISKKHLTSPKIGPYCVAATLQPVPDCLELLKEIEAKNPNEIVQGAAALGQSLLLKRLGDRPDIVRQRLILLRQAILKSTELDIGKTTVGAIASDELYTIQNLAVGKTAPEIVGQDVAGRQLKLSDFRGKVVVLYFWQTWMPEAERAQELMQALHKKIPAGQAMILGVNHDNPLNLRPLVADGEVPWKNFSDPEQEIAEAYRVRQWPKVFVIDGEGVIQHIGAPGAFVDLAVDALLVKP